MTILILLLLFTMYMNCDRQELLEERYEREFWWEWNNLRNK